MTRINTTTSNGLFTHDMLLDQHLFIAYREITRIHTMHRPLAPGEAPSEYVLGTGHMKFFYDKGLFLQRQCQELYDACVARGRWPNITHKEYKQHIQGMHNDWEPNTKAIATCLMRLQEKLFDKPNFYTLNGKPVSVDYYAQLLARVVQK